MILALIRLDLKQSSGRARDELFLEAKVLTLVGKQIWFRVTNIVHVFRGLFHSINFRQANVKRSSTEVEEPRQCARHPSSRVCATRRSCATLSHAHKVLLAIPLVTSGDAGEAVVDLGLVSTVTLAVARFAGRIFVVFDIFLLIEFVLMKLIYDKELICPTVLNYFFELDARLFTDQWPVKNVCKHSTCFFLGLWHICRFSLRFLRKILGRKILFLS